MSAGEGKVSGAASVGERLARAREAAGLSIADPVSYTHLDVYKRQIYLLREGMLELFATRGLAQEAVHVTRMGVGEGCLLYTSRCV